ncbi:MAG: DegT/DnrJ/EryC1/StrS family aminotransferase [bacterium]|nr:DegT/DnrJ/EryC1/StrS family aminotransferase [bacterium]MDW8087254.1 DegT/DnrJ/EryC1/StrS family aminotransferase [Candidatus Calescibacterium sp.]
MVQRKNKKREHLGEKHDSFIRLSKPYFGEIKEITSCIEDILESGYIIQGKYVAEFESLVAEYLGVKYAVAVSSGTSALHLSLIALGIGAGDGVIVPAYTFPATVNVIELVGAKPVLVDVDIETYNLKVKDISKFVSPKTKAVLPVHLFGNPADMEEISDVAKFYGLKIIEDAAGALGATYDGKKCGTFGEVGCFSFHPRKIISTGEGGIVATNNYEIAEKIRLLRNHGMRSDKYGRYDFFTVGFNYRMNELEAVLGINQMKKIHQILEERHKIYSIYFDLMRGIDEIEFQKSIPKSNPVWQAFVVRLKKHTNAELIEKLRAEGIEANIGTYAVHLLEFYKKKYNYKPDDFPNASELFTRSLALPFYNGITRREISKVVDVLRRHLL